MKRTTGPLANEPVRVVIIEDSEIQADALRGILEEEEGFRIVAMTSSGVQGVEEVIKLKPDLVLCDLGLPDITGFEVVTQIMSDAPTPIVIVTATLRPTWRRDAFDALAMGAIDVVEKPDISRLRDQQWRSTFRKQIRILARTKVIPHVFGRVRQRFKSKKIDKPPTGLRLLVIVASAGGPQAIQTVLENMRPHFPLPVATIIGMHIGSRLSGSYAAHLARCFNTRVNEAQDDERLVPGAIYVAPGGFHTEITPGFRLKVYDDVGTTGFKPSLDRLMRSAARHVGRTAAGVILTGMGTDGADGLLALRKTGGQTLGQDEESSPVYGMPKAAAECGAVLAQLPPEAIGSTLIDWLDLSEDDS